MKNDWAKKRIKNYTSENRIVKLKEAERRFFSKKREKIENST